MATKVLVPLLGEGVEEVTVTKWLKQEGDSVTELEALLEVNTDKVDTEIPAPASGTVLKILAQEGLPAKVGEVLAYIGQPGEALPGTPSTGTKPDEPGPGRPADGPPSASPPATGATANAIHAPGRNIGFISPVVAKLASEHGIDLKSVPGTGLNGRITKDDVLRFLQSGEGAAPSGTPATRAQPTPLAGDQLQKHTLIRRQIAEHMVLSQKTSPHVLTVMEADMTRVLEHRGAHKEPFAAQGVNLTMTAYFMMAIAAGLRANPMANSSWTEEGILVHSAVNLGMATSLGSEGLIVPVIKNADRMDLMQMARSVNDLAARARAKKLHPDDVKGGTFTLTNHGISGSLFALPIMNQPQCGILGTGALQKRVVAINDAIAIRPMVFLSFVFDHRILDGASADAFLAAVKTALQEWAN